MTKEDLLQDYMARKANPQPAPKFRPVAWLLPRHRVGLWAAYNRDDVPKFVAAWRAVWRRIPLGDRRTILRYWRTAEGDDFDQLRAIGTCPQISILRGRIGYVDAFATVGRYGSKINFKPEAVRDMATEVLETLIAHELAHIAFLAWPDPDAIQGEAYFYDPDAYCTVEAQTSYLMGAWGFDDDAIDEWFAQNRDRLPWLSERHDEPEDHPARHQWETETRELGRSLAALRGRS